MFDAMRSRGLRLAAVLSAAVLGGAVLLGCNLDRPLAPETASPPAFHAAAVLELAIVGERGEAIAGAPALGRLDRPADVAAALRALPPAARAELDAHGTCITTDAGFRAVVWELLAASDPRGVAGVINNSSWGRIKVRYFAS